MLRTRRSRTGAPALYRAVSIESLEPRRLLTVIAAFGDITAGTGALDVSNVVKGWNPDHIITLGDNFYDNDPTVDNTIGRYYHNYVSPYVGSFGAGSSSGNRLWPALGNHDWDHGLSSYTNYFTLPNNERYYTVTLGDTQWFVLDTDDREPDGNSSSSTQAQWLQSNLASSTARWKFVVSHDPPYTSADSPDATWMRWPFQQWGANAVFSGDKHLYERLNVGGMPYVIVGTGGAPLHAFSTTDSNSQFRYDSTYGALKITTSSTSANFQFINRNGTLIDSFSVGATSPPPPPPPPPPPGSSVTYVPTGSSWKYLDNGTNQGTTWRAVSFADTTWKTGNAQLGYGDGDEATVVSFGGSSSNKFVTTYFRKGFSVSDASAITGLSLRLKRDDGAVVYLNGTEVARSNMPTGTVGYTTLASSSIEDEAYKTATISPSLLASGTNVIAVEVHQGDRTSSDISFDFELTGTTTSSTPTAPSAPSGLAASAASSSQINLTWNDNSSVESGFRIERSTNGGTFSEIATVGANVTSYNSTGLSASTSYSYRVRAYNGGGNSGYSNTASATTPSSGGSTTTYLSDLEWVSATSGWGPVEKDKSVGGNGSGDGRTLTLNGTTYAKGIGTHAVSDIVYNLAGGYATFLSDIGVDDETGPGTVQFRVFADGVQIYDSGVMTQSSATKQVNVSVDGVQQLRLRVDNGGDDISYDHADWASARVVTAASAATTLASRSTATLFSTAPVKGEEDDLLALVG